MLDFYNSKYVKAKKCHICDLCGGLIQKGEVYHRYAGKYDGDFFDDKFHKDCQKIISQYCEENNESEYDNDSIQDWLHDKYCHECKHDEYNGGDCEEVNLLLCPIIRKHYEERVE